MIAMPTRGPALVLATLVVVSFLIGGGWGVGAGLLAVAALILGAHPRWLLLGATCGVALAMLAWVLGNVGESAVSFSVITGNPWPHRLAQTAVVLLMIGVFGEPRGVVPADPTLEGDR